MPPLITLDDIRRAAVGHTLFKPTSLARAINKLGFVQADPIRAPARAQDLMLRHRVTDYRAGDLEARYAKLGLEEGFFINYGFLPRATYAAMHPRMPRTVWSAATHKRAAAMLEFIRTRGSVHPREVDEHFAHGSVTNYWGGSSSASTQLLAGMHYRGMLRVAKRDHGIRVYAPHLVAPQPPADQRAALDNLMDVVINQYAPLPAASFAGLLGRLRYGVPQWRGEIKAAMVRAKARLVHARIEDVDWYWPHGVKVGAAHHAPQDVVRLLAPFDPIVWDRKRFEWLWGWAYRFEAYTPTAKRKLGYYALPLLWREHVIGWANVTAVNGDLQVQCGYVNGRAPRERAFKAALEAECDKMRTFLGL